MGTSQGRRALRYFLFGRAWVMALALRRIAAREFLECAAEVVRMNVAQFVSDFLYRDSIILQQLACPFHATPSVIGGDGLVQMRPEQAVERHSGDLKVFTKWSDRIAFLYILSQPA